MFNKLKVNKEYEELFEKDFKKDKEEFLVNFERTIRKYIEGSLIFDKFDEIVREFKE